MSSLKMKDLSSNPTAGNDDGWEAVCFCVSSRCDGTSWDSLVCLCYTWTLGRLLQKHLDPPTGTVLVQQTVVGSLWTVSWCLQCHFPTITNYLLNLHSVVATIHLQRDHRCYYVPTGWTCFMLCSIVKGFEKQYCRKQYCKKTILQENNIAEPFDFFFFKIVRKFNCPL